MNVRDLLVALKSKQEPIVTNLVKSLGILETAQYDFASDYLRHEYEVMTDDGAAAIRAVNGAIVATAENSIMASIQLPSIERLIEVDKRILKKWGSMDAFLADRGRTASYIRSVLQKLAKAMYYGDDATFGVPGAFKGLHQIAKANNKVKQLSGTSGSRTSIFAVRWIPGETQIVIPETDGGDLVQLELVGGGTLQAPTHDTTTGARKLLYGANLWISAALQAGSNYSVAAITQIDSGHKPTAGDIDKLIDDVKGSQFDTFLYMNREARRYVRELKNTKLQMTPADRNYSTAIHEWDGINVVLDEFIVSNETTVLD